MPQHTEPEKVSVTQLVAETGSPSTSVSLEKGDQLTPAIDEKKDPLQQEIPNYDSDNAGVPEIIAPVTTAKDLITQVIHVEDDPTQNPWTFRVFVLGVLPHLFSSCWHVTNPEQELALQYSEPFYRRYSSSSLRASSLYVPKLLPQFHLVKKPKTHTDSYSRVSSS